MRQTQYAPPRALIDPMTLTLKRLPLLHWHGNLSVNFAFIEMFLLQVLAMRVRQYDHDL